MQSKLLCALCNIAVDFCDWHPRNLTPGINGSDPGCTLDFVLLTIIEQLYFTAILMFQSTGIV